MATTRPTFPAVLSNWVGGSGILLKVAGADILIQDIYDRPLPLIQQLIKFYRTKPQLVYRTKPQLAEAEPIWHFDPQQMADDLPAESSPSDQGRFRRRGERD